MSSIIEGYEYDIFISYRQNDNKRDGWVSDFVQALRDELDATLKNPVSIYFDENVDDGLLETDQVSPTLKKKLKCLVFIPIISQTYCDTQSFAWEHEFLAFNKLASEDALGMNITLKNGNVVTRVLPIKIHDLDPEDQNLLAAELSGPLRSIDFIYRAAGVNRPLLLNENDPNANLNKTYYRDQINKVANALKEIGISILRYFREPKTTHKLTEETSIFQDLTEPNTTKRSQKLIWAGSILTILILSTYFVFSTFFNQVKNTDDPEKSIAVLAFENISNDPDQEYLADGLSEEILNLLANIPDLKVIGRTSSFAFKGKHEDLREIAQKLEVAHILEGSVRKSGDQIRITVQLIKGSDGSHIWSETYDRTLNDIFAVQDEIAGIVTETLKVTLLQKSGSQYDHKISAEAYNLFLRGKFYYEENSDIESTKSAEGWFKESIKLDSAYSIAWTYLSMCYWRQASSSDQLMFKKAKSAAEKAIRFDPTSAIAAVNMAEILDNEYDLKSAEKQIKLALKLDPIDPYVLRNACRFYTILEKKELSIEYGKMSLKNDPYQRTALQYLMMAYFYSGQYSDAKILAKGAAEQGHPGSYSRLYNILLEEGNASQIIAESNNQNHANDTPTIASAYFLLGKQAEAESILAKIAKDCPDACAYQIARAYAYGEAKAEVLKWLERSYENKEKRLVYLAVDPAFKAFRNEQKVVDILTNMKYPM